MVPSDVDRKFLRRCIELVQEALSNGDERFGSVLVSSQGDLLHEELNRVGEDDATLHPEIVLSR